MTIETQQRIVAMCAEFGIPADCILFWDNGHVSINHPSPEVPNLIMVISFII